ncbi:MAG: hypothetical protein Q7S98_06130 [Deltaproteobacteria bacterium]|nr:hypothetical protein [Deltaproteobacteria bacterium]
MVLNPTTGTINTAPPRFFVPETIFWSRPSERIRQLLDQAPTQSLGVHSMMTETDGETMENPLLRPDVIEIYRRLYERPYSVNPLWNASFPSDIICETRISAYGHPSDGDYSQLCVGESPNHCTQELGIRLDIQPYCAQVETFGSFLEILHPYDDQIWAAAHLVANLHNMKPANVYLTFYASFLQEMTHLEPHDIWQDVSACTWAGDLWGDECSFSDRIDETLFNSAYAMYDDPLVTALRQFHSDDAAHDCSFLPQLYFWKDKTPKNCADDPAVRDNISSLRPDWERRMIWRVASMKEKTDRHKQGFGPGQVILGYALKAAQDPEVFQPFVEAGFLTPDNFKNDEAAMRTVLDPETFVFAKALTINLALTHLERTDFYDPEVAFPSNYGYLIPNAATAREVALLVEAENDARFPDENPYGDDPSSSFQKENLINNNQDTVIRLALVSYLLGVELETPGLSFQADSTAEIFRKGARLAVDNPDIFAYGRAGIYSMTEGNRTYLHWAPPAEWEPIDSNAVCRWQN